jgi:hypothetical protein
MLNRNGAPSAAVCVTSSSRLSFAKSGLKAERFPSGCLAQIEAEFRLREIKRPRRSECSHNGEAVRLQHTAQLFERNDRVWPEMNHAD